VTIGLELTTDIYNALPANVNTINTTFEALYMLAQSMFSDWMPGNLPDQGIYGAQQHIVILRVENKWSDAAMPENPHRRRAVTLYQSQSDAALSI
jgi:hypothetical protein